MYPSLINSRPVVLKMIVFLSIVFIGVSYAQAIIYEYKLPAGNLTDAKLKSELNALCKQNCFSDTVKLTIEDGVKVVVSPVGENWDLSNYSTIILEVLGKTGTGKGGGELFLPKKSHVLLSENSLVLVDSLNSSGLVAEHGSNSYINIGLATYHGSVFKMIISSGGANSTGFGSKVPVSLYYFDVKKSKNGAVVLNWATLNEENSKHFEIQKSDDGLHFHTVAKVNGAGNSEEYIEYSFEDEVLSPSSQVYYRLSHVDYSGEKIELEIVNVKMHK